MEIGAILGCNLKSRRIEKGFTQEQLASSAGISAFHLRNMEHGRGNPALKTVYRLSASLETTIDWLTTDHTHF